MLEIQLNYRMSNSTFSIPHNFFVTISYRLHSTRMSYWSAFQRENMRMRSRYAVTLMHQYIVDYSLLSRLCITRITPYTLSHLKNNRDVSTYSSRRCLLSRAKLVCFLTRSKINTEIDA